MVRRLFCRIVLPYQPCDKARGFLLSTHFEVRFGKTLEKGNPFRNGTEPGKEGYFNQQHTEPFVILTFKRPIFKGESDTFFYFPEAKLYRSFHYDLFANISNHKEDLRLLEKHLCEVNQTIPRSLWPSPTDDVPWELYSTNYIAKVNKQLYTWYEKVPPEVKKSVSPAARSVEEKRLEQFGCNDGGKTRHQDSKTRCTQAPSGQSENPTDPTTLIGGQDPWSCDPMEGELAQLSLQAVDLNSSQDLWPTTLFSPKEPKNLLRPLSDHKEKHFSYLTPEEVKKLEEQKDAEATRAYFANLSDAEWEALENRWED